MSALPDAAAQAWPPFALVAGLLAVGAVAESEGLFAAAAAKVTRPDRSPLLVLAGLLALDATVTALLNLDTAAAFMTPLMLYAARELGADEAPYLYGAVLMANAASLLLPGANLTNLLVLSQEQVSGATFVARTLPTALATVVVTGAGLLVWASRARETAARGSSHAAPSFRPRVGTIAVAVSAVLVLLLRDPALPVLAVGVVTAAVT